VAVARVAVVADDLIWSTRLREQLREAGARPVAVRDRSALEAALPDVDAAVVDLTARAYDGIELVGLAVAAGCRVMAIGQHDDREGRRRATVAGAERVVAYRQLAEKGPAVLAHWLGSDPTDRLEPTAAEGEVTA
jgi:DNA-binding response OmpR family regulator